ncbi:hypothetical protein V7128_07500 [Neobacillus vireti]|uniref:hypothetical protein n=1 Tax=Neobacillus vireti TaxID=220686 RepID=UPI002FFEC320
MEKTFEQVLAEAVFTSEVMDEIRLGFRNIVILVEELEQLADVSDKEVAQSVGELYMVLLKATVAKVNDLLGILYEAKDEVALQLLSKDLKEDLAGKEHYVVVALMLTGSDLGGIL